MDKIQAWLQDKKNLPIVAAGTGVIIIAAVVVVLFMTGTIGGSKMDYDYQAQQPMESQGYQPTDVGHHDPHADPYGDHQPADPAADPLAEEQQVQQVAAETQPPMLPYRKDPFVPLAGPPRRADVIASILPTVSRPRIAPAPVAERVEMTETEVLPPQPFRRMAGVMYNGRVAAILETEGETDIVRPGMELTRGNSKVRVERIEQDHIILKTLDTRTPMTIRVGMAGSIAGGAEQGVVHDPHAYGGMPGDEW